MTSFKTVLCCLAVALTLVSTVKAHSETNYPAFLWSGKEHFTGKSKHFQNCNTRGLSTLVENVVFESTEPNSPYFHVSYEKPNVFLAFVHPRLLSQDFLKHSGAFQSETKNSFPHLQNYVRESGSSLVFPSCAISSSISSSMQEISERNPNANSLFINSGADSISMNDFKNNAKDYIKPDQTNFFVVNLEHTSEKADQHFAAIDSLMNDIVQDVQDITEGNYVAMLTSNHEEQETASLKRTLLSAKDDDNGAGKNDPSPWNPTQVSSNITSASLAIVLTFVLIGLVSCVGFVQLHEVKTAPHITETIPDVSSS